MSKDKKRLVPVRRFKEFENAPAWEQRKLGDVADIVGGGTPSTKVKEYWNGNINWYSPVEIGTSIYTSESVKKITQLGLEKSSAKILPKGTVLFTSRAGIGNTAILTKEATTNQGFQSIVPKKGLLNSYFIFTETPFLKRYGEINGAGSTFVEVSGKQMSKMPLLLPSFDEQLKIGNFFKQLDSLIALHQRKLDKLKRVKSAYLTEMFPAEGEREPKRRFPGFTGAWEQRKLGDVADIVGGGTPSTKVKEYWNGNINWYSPVEIGTSIYTSESVKKITQLGLEKSSAKILPKGTVLFTSRAGIGNTAILTKEATTNQGFQSIVPKKGLLNSYFIFTETPFLKRYGEINGAGSTFVEVSGKQMSKMPLLLPSFDEQLKIGNFFKQLDSLIALHQRKLDKLKKMKAAYLEEMFV